MFGLDLFLIKKVLSWAIGFAVKNWRIITVTILLAGTFAAGWYNGSDSVKRDWEVDIHLRVKEQLAAAEKSQKQLVVLQEKANAESQDNTRLRANNHALWLRLPKTPCGGPDTPGADNTSTTGELPTKGERDLAEAKRQLDDEAYRADEIVKECRVLNDFNSRPR